MRDNRHRIKFLRFHQLDTCSIPVYRYHIYWQNEKSPRSLCMCHISQRSLLVIKCRISQNICWKYFWLGTFPMLLRFFRFALFSIFFIAVKLIQNVLEMSKMINITTHCRHDFWFVWTICGWLLRSGSDTCCIQATIIQAKIWAQICENLVLHWFLCGSERNTVNHFHIRSLYSFSRIQQKFNDNLCVDSTTV